MEPDSENQRQKTEALKSAVYFLFIFLIFSLLLRIWNFIALAEEESIALSLIGPPFSLPFILGEELIIGTIFSAVLMASWRHRLLRISWLAIISLYLVFLAFEQIAYKTFFSHVDYVLYETSHDVARLWSSIKGSFDVYFAIDIAAAVFASLLLFVTSRPHFIHKLAAIIRQKPKAAALCIAGYIALSIALSISGNQHGLNRSFPLAYSLSYIESKAEDAELERAFSTSNPVAKAQVERPLFSAKHKTNNKETVALKINKAKKLNVVLYLMESASLRETSLCSQNKYDTTPFLKSLASSSLVFRNYYTGFAASTRAFFSTLTGLYPYIDKSADVAKYSRLNVQNLVNALHDEGYITAFFSSSDTLFDSLDTLIGSLKYDYYLDMNLLPREAADKVPAGSWGVDEETVIDSALEWIENNKDKGKPFFINYNAVYPHHPFQVPRQHADLLNMDWGRDGLKSNYRASLYYADMSVKRFYEGLKRLNLLDDTLFIVTPDHGETFGDVHKENLIHAEFCYNEDYQIFLMFHNPDLLGSHKENNRFGTHADLFPTVLNLLGIKMDLNIDGQSLLANDYKERMIFCASRRQFGVRDGNYKFVMFRSGDKQQLYDLSSDPKEQNDISRAHPEKVDAYAKVVRDWQISVIRAYRERAEQAGLSSGEIQRLASERRQEIFSQAQAQIKSAAVCAGGVCAAPSNEKTFTIGQTLNVEVHVEKPGSMALQVELFNPSGTRILKQKTPHQCTRDLISTAIEGNNLAVPGKYRARVFLLSSHAVHDSTVIWFSVK